MILLLHRIDPSANNNQAIQIASEIGQTDIVKLLLQDSRVDPTSLHSYAMKEAFKNGHKDVVALLLQNPKIDPEIKKAVQLLQN